MSRKNGSYDHESMLQLPSPYVRDSLCRFLLFEHVGVGPPTQEEAGRCGAKLLVKLAVFLPANALKNARYHELNEKSTSLFREHGYFFERMDRAQRMGRIYPLDGCWVYSKLRSTGENGGRKAWITRFIGNSVDSLVYRLWSRVECGKKVIKSRKLKGNYLMEEKKKRNLCVIRFYIPSIMLDSFVFPLEFFSSIKRLRNK